MVRDVRKITSTFVAYTKPAQAMSLGEILEGMR